MTTDAPTLEQQASALQAYFRAGEARARALGNRGPARFTAKGKLAPEIVETYLEVGFYVFEGLVDQAEVEELKAEFHGLLERLPARREDAVDRHGRPALAHGLSPSPLHWSKPLGDPMGGSTASPRSPVKMIEGQPAADLPGEIVYIIQAPLQFSDAALRTYAHPALLAISAAINGEDFTPFSEGYVVKKPGEGAAFAWHQDGVTHWEGPQAGPLAHGFNFMLQLYRSTAANGVWYVPGTHRRKVDIPAMIAKVGGNLLPTAVPLVCEPGDVAISNRQVLHGSFANNSPDWRVSLNFGFHPRMSVLDVRPGGHLPPGGAYDADYVRKRCEVIGYAIDARRQRFPQDTPFAYAPHVAGGERYSWDEAAREAIRGYHVRDLGI
jgi:hypothetical protein